MYKQAIAPLVLAVMTLVCIIVATLIGRPFWAAAVGGGLVLVYWALEVLAWRRGESRASFGAALGVALGGMVLRLALVLAVLVLVGVLARPAFATAALAFLAAFTVYVGVRLFTYPVMHGPAGSPGAGR
jgi:hypothetical protein